MGELAYQAYCDSTDGISLVSGDTLPSWHDLPSRIRDAWESVGRIVSDVTRASIMESLEKSEP